MSKDLQTLPKEQKSASGPQFQSGLEQSQFFGADLEGKQPRSSAGAPAESARRWQIRYADLTIGASKGRGAYGEVFAGDYRRSKVAIKVYDFRGQLAEKQKAEVLHEADLMESLRSEYLVGFRGICFDPRYCLVMEYCDGGTLRGRLDKADAVSFPEQLRWAMQISYGVYQLHSVKIIHRDLKGENILLDGQGHAKVADFGLSLVKSSSASQSKRTSHGSAGTLPWMAPELFEDEPNSVATDVYSLGMVLWEIISGKQPFAGKMPGVIIGQVSSGKRQPLESNWPVVFRTFIQACWDADPSKRPTAEKVGDEFGAALKSVVPTPQSPIKTAAELEVEKLREQLRQAQLEKQQDAKKAAEKEQQLRAQKEAEMKWLQEENEKLKQKQLSQAPAAQSPGHVIPAKVGIHDVAQPLDSRLRGNDMPISTPTLTPPPQPPPPPSQNPQSLMPAPKPAVDAKALGQLLKFVAEGEQDQAEEMLRGKAGGFLGFGSIKAQPELLLASGPVTDLSGRTFQTVTAFQYALWAMDWHMWTMVKKYLPTEAQAQQFNLLETKGTEHGKHYDIKPLTDALQTYVDNAEKWNYDQRAVDQWNKGVGGAQRLVPAHVVNEYARPDRPFEPCPTEWESKLPRTREMQVWDGSKYVKGSWFIAPSSKESLGSTFAFYRYNNNGARGSVCVVLRAVGGAAGDLKALQSLWKTRTEQMELLKSELSAAAGQSQALRFG